MNSHDEPQNVRCDVNRERERGGEKESVTGGKTQKREFIKTFAPIDNQFMFCFGRICDPTAVWERIRRRPDPKKRQLLCLKTLFNLSVFFLSFFFLAWSEATPASLLPPLTTSHCRTHFFFLLMTISYL